MDKDFVIFYDGSDGYKGKLYGYILQEEDQLSIFLWEQKGNIPSPLTFQKQVILSLKKILSFYEISLDRCHVYLKMTERVGETKSYYFKLKNDEFTWERNRKF